MFEVTVVLCKMNIFHRGCLSVGNARHGYTSRVRDFFSQGQIGGKNVWPCADRDGQESMGCVWPGAEFSLNNVQRKIKVVERDGR